jgi:Family of unknown function (DUF5906)
MSGPKLVVDDKRHLFGDPANDAQPSAKPANDLDTAMQWFDQRFAVITDNGKTQVYWTHEDGMTVPYLTLNDFFSAWTQNKIIITSELPGGLGQTHKEFEAAKYWFYKYKHRRTKHFTCFDPRGGAPPNTFNFWPGFGVNIRHVDDDFLEWYDKWKLVIDFLNDIICSDDDVSYDYLQQWIGHLIQRPWEKPEVSIVLIGTKGTGKSLFAKLLERLIDGDRKYCLYFKTVKEKDFTGNFNDHLRHKLLFTLDEASYMRSPSILSVINDIVTSKEVAIGKKFASTTMSEDFLRVVINANPPWTLPVTWDERRFLVLNPSQERLGDSEYYAQIDDALNDMRVIEALHYIFSEVDITKFNPRIVPHTEAMMRNRIAQLSGIDLWVFELANYGFIDAWKIDGEAFILKDTLRHSYNEFRKARYDDKKEIDATKFGMELGRLLPAIDDKGNVVMNNGRVVSIIEENRQRNTAILKKRPDLALDENKFSYSYVLPALDHFQNLLNISLKIKYDWSGNSAWDYFNNRPM